MTRAPILLALLVLGFSLVGRTQSLSYSTYLPSPAIQGGALLAVDSSGAACVTDGTTLWTFDASGHATVTVPNIASASGIFVSTPFRPGFAAVARDQQGNCYVAGGVTSPVPSATVFGHAVSGIAKFSPTGSLLYATYFGGDPNGTTPLLSLQIVAIAVDSAGNAYLAGNTNFPDLPLKNPIQNLLQTGGGEESVDAFILKLDSTGANLVYSTYYGVATRVAGIAADTSGNAFLTGAGTVTTTPGAFQTTPQQSGANWVTKINPAGIVTYATYLSGAGAGADFEAAIAADANGSAYVAGRSCSGHFPTTMGSFQSSASGPCNGVVSKLSSDGSTLVYSTYIGGSDTNQFNAIAVDGNGIAYLAGQAGPNFPLMNPIQGEIPCVSPTPGQCQTTAATITVLNSTGTALTSSTFFQGLDLDTILSIGADATGNVYLGGQIGILLEDTGIDSFLILNANNGLLQPFLPCEPLACTTLRPFVAKVAAGTSSVLASPSAVDFGNLPLSAGTTGAVPLLIANAGFPDIQVSNVTITGDFQISANSCSGTVASAKSCVVSVAFVPTAGGKRTGQLTITSSAPDSPRVIQLTGAAGVPAVSLNVTSLSLTSPSVGAAGPPQTVMLANTGSDVLDISALAIVGASAADFSETHDCSGTLTVKNSCQIQITYKASTANLESATLQITDNAAGSPHTVSLTGSISSLGLALASGASPNATVTAGQTASYNLAIGGVSFNGNVTLSCSGAPSGASCSLPSSETLSSTPVGFQVMVATTPRTSASASGIHFGSRHMAAMAFLGLPALVLAGAARRRRKALALLGICLCLLAIASCGGSSGSGGGGPKSPGGTPAGTFTLTVTAANSAGTSQSMNLTLNVN